MQEYGLEFEQPRSPYNSEEKNNFEFSGECLDVVLLASYQRLTENILNYHYDEYANGNWHWE
jgi:hypothetical protein